MRPIQYTITAVDRATAVLDRINNSVGRMTQPLSRLGNSVRRLGDTTGVNRLARGVGDLSSKVRSLLGFVLKLGTPLLALFGGGSIAGLYQMTEGWARLGFAASSTSQIIGISTQKLMELRGIGDLTGISAETMTKGFQSFADTLQDAKWGRNQAVFGMMQMLGIGLKHTRTGVIDTEAVLLKLADKIKVIQKRDPAAARKLAQSFGVEELLPVLMQGSKAMRGYQQETKKLQESITPSMIERANNFTLSINKMKMATNGTKAAIADKLIPVFQPLIDKWTKWLVVNRQEISDKIAKLAERLAKWLDKIDFEKVLEGIIKFIDGCIKLVKWVDKTVEKFGGWENVLKGLAVLIGVSFVASIGVAIGSLGGIIAKLGIATGAMGALRLAGGLAISALAGWKIGSWINENFVEGTKFGDWLGEKITKGLAFVGLPSAKEAVSNMEKYEGMSKTPSPTVSNPTFANFKNSIITQESRGNYSAVNKRTGAMGFAQIMPQNIVGWGKNAGKKKHGWDYEALGYDITPKQFLSSPELQHKIIDYKLKQAFDKYGAAGAARWWYSNNPNPSTKRPTPSEPSPNEYASSVLNRMKGGAGSNTASQPQVNVTVQNTVHPDGSSTTKVATPQGVKIKHNAPGIMP